MWGPGRPRTRPPLSRAESAVPYMLHRGQYGVLSFGAYGRVLPVKTSGDLTTGAGDNSGVFESWVLVLQRFNKDCFKIQGKRLACQKMRASALYRCVPLLCTFSWRYYKEVSFHPFPVDAVVWAEWMQKIWRETSTWPKNTQVCSRHIQQTDFNVTERGGEEDEEGRPAGLFLLWVRTTYTQTRHLGTTWLKTT